MKHIKLPLLWLCLLVWAGCEREKLSPDLPEPVVIDQIVDLGGVPCIGLRIVQESNPNPTFSGIFDVDVQMSLANQTSQAIAEVDYLLEIFSSSVHTSENLLLRYRGQANSLPPIQRGAQFPIDGWDKGILEADQLEFALLEVSEFPSHPFGGMYQGEFSAFDGEDKLKVSGSAFGRISADGKAKFSLTGNGAAQLVSGFFRASDSLFIGQLEDSLAQAISPVQTPDTLPPALDSLGRLVLDLPLDFSANADQIHRLYFLMTKQN